MKKIISVLMAVLLLASIGSFAFADDGGIWDDSDELVTIDLPQVGLVFHLPYDLIAGSQGHIDVEYGDELGYASGAYYTEIGYMAMSEEEFNRAIQIGSDLVDDCIAEGCRILSIGEMGIANTSPSSIWMSIFGDIPLKDCIGAGAGLDKPGIRHKYEVLSKSLERYRQHEPQSEPTTPLRYFGGFEMIAAIGAMLRAAEQHLVVLIDGFIMTACAVAAIRLYPTAKDYMIFTHCGDESGHKRMLDMVGAKPLLHLGLRLGEGTGALCTYPLIDSAVRMINEMNNFDNARITKYF